MSPPTFRESHPERSDPTRYVHFNGQVSDSQVYKFHQPEMSAMKCKMPFGDLRLKNQPNQTKNREFFVVFFFPKPILKKYATVKLDHLTTNRGERKK